VSAPAAARHARPNPGLRESIETSSVHLDLPLDLRIVNDRIADVGAVVERRRRRGEVAAE
jgi:Na+/phosphate symporter